MQNESFFLKNHLTLSHIYGELQAHHAILINIIHKKNALLRSGFYSARSPEYETLCKEYQRVQHRVNHLNDLKERLKNGESLKDKGLWY